MSGLIQTDVHLPQTGQDNHNSLSKMGRVSDNWALTLNAKYVVVTSILCLLPSRRGHNSGHKPGLLKRNSAEAFFKPTWPQLLWNFQFKHYFQLLMAKTATLVHMFDMLMLHHHSSSLQTVVCLHLSVTQHYFVFHCSGWLWVYLLACRGILVCGHC